jgi:hypothetical protein
VPLTGPLDGLPQDIAVLDTCVKAVLSAWRVAPIPDVDISGELDRKAALRREWSALAIALDDLAACADLASLLRA